MMSDLLKQSTHDVLFGELEVQNWTSELLDISLVIVTQLELQPMRADMGVVLRPLCLHEYAHHQSHCPNRPKVSSRL